MTISEHNTTSLTQPALALRVGSYLDPGIRRKYKPNEDTLLVIQKMLPAQSPSSLAQPIVLLAVADGMGGLGHGQEASQLAIQALIEHIEDTISSTRNTPDDLLSLLLEGVYAANQLVYTRNQQQSLTMGTTMTAALISKTTAYIAHVGDSRLYGYRKSSGLIQMTRDHSLVAMLVEAKILAPDSIYTHPKRNQIYRSLGTQPTMDVDTFAISLTAGDILLLCSDGLWEMVRDREISAILTAPLPGPADTARALINAALDAGGDDNVSAIVARVITNEQ